MPNEMPSAMLYVKGMARMAIYAGMASVGSLKLMRGGKGGNCQEEGGKEQGEGKENGYGDGGKTGPSAFRNASRTFYEGGRGGNAEARADGGGDSVSHESAFDAGQLPFLIKHVCFGRNADQGAEGIKNIHEKEREEDDEEIRAHHL